MFNYRRGYMAETRLKPLNPLLAEGIVVSHMKEVESFYNLILNCAFNGSGGRGGEGPIKGFEYVGMERCSPEEQFRHSTKKVRNKRICDLSRSYVFMVKLTFRWQGEPIIRYLYLPYVRDAGSIELSGSCFIIHPVLDNPDISATHDSIFVRLLRSRFNVKSMAGAFIKDGEYSACRLLTAIMHNKPIDKTTERYGQLSKVRPNLAHFLFAKHGLREAFKRYAKAEVYCVSEKEIIPEDFPKTEWIHCSPLVRSMDSSRPTPLLLIRRAHWNNVTESLVGGFYYIYNIFMDRIQADYITSDEDEINLWRILLGHVTFKSDASESKVLADTHDHMNSLDYYIDTASHEDLRRSNLEVNDLYELFAYLMENFFTLTTQSDDSSMAGKRLNTLRYVCGRLISQTFLCLFNIINVMNKPRVTIESFRRIFNKNLSHDLIFRINSDGVIVQAASASMDNMAMNITNHIVPQNETASKVKGSKISNNDPTLRLDASVAEFGSLVHQPKNNPTGRNRLNLWSNINRNSELIPDPAKSIINMDLAKKIAR